MPTLTIKNVPDDLYKQLKQMASHHRRSINSEVLVSLERCFQKPRRDVKEILSRIRRLRKKTAGHRLTDKILSQAKSEGRL